MGFHRSILRALEFVLALSPPFVVLATLLPPMSRRRFLLYLIASGSFVVIGRLEKEAIEHVQPCESIQVRGSLVIGAIEHVPLAGLMEVDTHAVFDSRHYIRALFPIRRIGIQLIIRFQPSVFQVPLM